MTLDVLSEARLNRPLAASRNFDLYGHSLADSVVLVLEPGVRQFKELAKLVSYDWAESGEMRLEFSDKTYMTCFDNNQHIHRFYRHMDLEGLTRDLNPTMRSGPMSLMAMYLISPSNASNSNYGGLAELDMKYFALFDEKLGFPKDDDSLSALMLAYTPRLI